MNAYISDYQWIFNAMTTNESVGRMQRDLVVEKLQEAYGMSQSEAIDNAAFLQRFCEPM